MNQVPCTYSMTFNVDITKLLANLKKLKFKLYPAIIFSLAYTVNQFSEFRMSIDDAGNLGYFEFIHPAYTILNDDTKTFSSIWTEYCHEFGEFHNQYLSDVQQYSKSNKMFPPTNLPTNIFNISMIPWVEFTGFNLNLPKGHNYFLPIFTIGKYTKTQDKTVLPIAIQLNHAVCDGYHLASFVESFQSFIDSDNLFNLGQGI